MFAELEDEMRKMLIVNVIPKIDGFMTALVNNKLPKAAKEKRKPGDGRRSSDTTVKLSKFGNSSGGNIRREKTVYVGNPTPRIPFLVNNILRSNKQNDLSTAGPGYEKSHRRTRPLIVGRSSSGSRDDFDLNLENSRKEKVVSYNISASAELSISCSKPNATRGTRAAHHSTHGENEQTNVFSSSDPVCRVKQDVLEKPSSNLSPLPFYLTTTTTTTDDAASFQSMSVHF